VSYTLKKEGTMKHLLDKGGAFGALITATAVPCCFPLLAPIGVALGFGALLPFAEYALYGVVVCAVVAIVGSVIAFRSPRHLVWLLLSVGSGLLVIAALRLPWPPCLAYAGLLGLAGAAVANHVLVRRASGTVMPRSTAQRPSEKACPLCQGETPEKTEVSLRAN
jgi:xanthosine utilization system XapX-like protein